MPFMLHAHNWGVQPAEVPNLQSVSGWFAYVAAVTDNCTLHWYGSVRYRGCKTWRVLSWHVSDMQGTVLAKTFFHGSTQSCTRNDTWLMAVLPYAS